MGIRTGRQYIESLHDGRQMWIDGELVADVTTDRRFAAAAYTMAELYDMQHDPKLVERMTHRSPTSGDRVGLSFIQPRTVDDLVRRREMVKTWMDATCGMFGRSPDFMNITLTGFASACDVFGQKDRSEEHTSELQSRQYLVCRLLLEKKNVDPSKRRVGIGRDTDAVLLEEACRAHEDAVRDDAGAGIGLKIAGHFQRELPAVCSVQDDAGQRVFASLFGRRRQAKHLVGRHVGQRHDLAELEPALGDGAGLVERHRPHAGQPFQRGAALEQDAGARQPAEG